MSYHWYALHVKPHKERSVFDLLRSKNIEVYYPRLRVKPVNPRSRKERPFFPGYMFVYINLDDDGVSILRWTEGTHGLIEYGGEPASVPANLILNLQQRLATMQPENSDAERFKKGDIVSIVDGAFEGYEAIFDAKLPGKDRVRVLLTYLNDQPKQLQIAPSQIVKRR